AWHLLHAGLIAAPHAGVRRSLPELLEERERTALACRGVSQRAIGARCTPRRQMERLPAMASAPKASPLEWLRARDPGLAALRRAGRTAIVMPILFAVTNEVIGNPEMATFAAFGSFALLVLVDFGGSMRERLQAQVALALAGGALVCLATLASRNDWL